MKKFLNIISSLSLITMAGTSVISCKSETKKYQKYFLPKQPKTPGDIGQALKTLIEKRDILEVKIAKAMNEREEQSILDFYYESEDYQNWIIVLGFIRAYITYKMYQLDIKFVTFDFKKISKTIPRITKDNFDNHINYYVTKIDIGVTNETKEYLKAIKVWTHTDALTEN